ncbi:hypothetical protein HanLR1_Chr17g0650001 [Helianthus annuus]|nr:hypothetical protein HanLR1_Chr17g0650001 [Helianthus annuus]
MADCYVVGVRDSRSENHTSIWLSCLKCELGLCESFGTLCKFFSIKSSYGSECLCHAMCFMYRFLMNAGKNDSDKIYGILKTACDIHGLPLAQTWACGLNTVVLFPMKGYTEELW